MPLLKVIPPQKNMLEGIALNQKFSEIGCTAKNETFQYLK
jgi:hypothetical protein